VHILTASSTGQDAPLFGPWQTEPYQPPPVVDGKVRTLGGWELLVFDARATQVPRNEYGDLDLFQPSMLPKGCAHVTVPRAAQLARRLGIDYVPALIGFEFRGALVPPTCWLQPALTHHPGGRSVPNISGIVVLQSNARLIEEAAQEEVIKVQIACLDCALCALSHCVTPQKEETTRVKRQQAVLARWVSLTQRLLIRQQLMVHMQPGIS
jgi:hypothetical protein